ncbi:MAG TPA: deoxyribodipyrimidine photo-lyase, partial [Bacteroidales bacterium]|nr:deoxyribodipyrimidine photo-lyase [Bacteroidales bacterium]
MQTEQVVVFWFRRDLRLDDNHALFEALNSGFPVLPLFIFDSEILGKLRSIKDARLTFIHQQLQQINEELKSSNSGL